jgi:hypothetical protein
MEIKHSAPFFARILTGLVLLGSQGLTMAQTCCPGMDGIRNVGGLGTTAAMIHEVIATLAVDSIWNRYAPSNRTYTSFKVVSKSDVDTSLFSNVVGDSNRTGFKIASFGYQAADFPDAHIDSSRTWGYKAGDTLKDVFVLQTDNGKGWREWHITGIHCKYLSPAPSPFPVKQALAAFNRYLDSLAKGKPQASDGHLGPVFELVNGDPGRMLTAFPDSGYWYFDHVIGSGDCPAGCTQHTENVYRVDNLGNVRPVSTRSYFGSCPPAEIVLRPGTASRSAGDGRCFTADGRTAEKNPAIRSKGARVLRSADPKKQKSPL